MSNEVPTLTINNNSPIYDTETITWNAYTASNTINYFDILIYLTMDLTKPILKTTIRSSQTNYKIPAGYLKRATSYTVTIIGYYKDNKSGQVQTIVSNSKVLETFADNRNVTFFCSPSSIKTSDINTTEVTVNWVISQQDFDALQSGDISPVIWPGNGSVMGAATGYYYAQVEDTTTFTLRLYFKDGSTAIRTATVNLEFIPPQLTEGQFSADDIKPGDIYVELDHFYNVSITPVKLKQIILYFYFMVNGSLQNIPITNEILLTGVTDISVPITAKYLNTYTLDSGRGVSGSLGYSAITIDSDIVYSTNVQSFKLINTRPKSGTSDNTLI